MYSRNERTKSPDNIKISSNAGFSELHGVQGFTHSYLEGIIHHTAATRNKVMILYLSFSSLSLQQESQRVLQMTLLDSIQFLNTEQILLNNFSCGPVCQFIPF